jgi:hypothetical protein
MQVMRQFMTLRAKGDWTTKGGLSSNRIWLGMS